ncbi:MAG: HAMP domain-containing protein [Acidobacteriales bacterium]|nr:HAMP domain-containing protein [Terriglobales bacterium]
MRSRIFFKLLAFFLLPILVATLYLDLSIRRSWEASLRSELDSSLEQKGHMLSLGIVVAPGCLPLDPSVARSFASTVAAQANAAAARVTVIDRCGNVLADSEADPKTMENHAQRPEFAAVLGGAARGESARLSHTVGVEFLYVAVPLSSGNGAVRLAFPLTGIQERAAGIRRSILATSAAALLLAAILAAVVAGSFTRRLQRIVTFADRIAAGELAARIEERASDELAHVAIALDHTARKLEESFREVQARRQELETLLNSMQEPVVAVSEDRRTQWANGRMQALFPGRLKLGAPLVENIRDPELLAAVQQTLETRDITHARAGMVAPGRIFKVTCAPLSAGGGAVAVLHEITEVERVEKTRRDFIANVSHELRTPLTSIQGYTETLLETAADDPAREFLEIIRKNASRMTRLTEDLLVLARVESGEEEFRFRSVPATEVLNEAQESCAELAKLRGQTLFVEAPVARAVRCDPDKIQQVFTNLVENALKYSSPGSTVTLGARETDHSVEFYVRDQGLGIPSEHLPRLFERFYRVDKARSLESGGTGLGLAIAKHIVLKHGGSIRAESELSKGSTFYFTLPAGE